MITHAIFDVDGTLTDSMYIWETMGQQFLRRRGIEAPPDLDRRLKVMSLRNACRYLNETYALGQTTEETMAEVNDRVEQEYTERVPLKPYVREILKRLQDRGARMGIVTASEESHVAAALQRLNIADCFEFILSCNQTGLDKENPELFRMAARRLGAPPEQVVVFEDALHAIKTAKQAGFRVMGVQDPSSVSDEAQIRMLCERYVCDYHELEAIV